MNIHERIGKALEDAELTDTSNVMWIEGSGDQREHTQMIRDLLTALESVGLTIVAERDPFGDDEVTVPAPSWQTVIDTLAERITKIEDWIDQDRQSVIDTLAERVAEIWDQHLTDGQTVVASNGRAHGVPVSPEEIPEELLEILDQRAGKQHSRQGSVVRCLAEILTRWEEVRMDLS